MGLRLGDGFFRPGPLYPALPGTVAGPFPLEPSTAKGNLAATPSGRDCRICL
jgi:hypothetical protein